MNTTLTANITGGEDILIAANTASDGWFGILFVLIVAALVFVTLSRKNEPQDAIMVTGFVSFILSSILLMFGMVNVVVVTISLLVLVGATAFRKQ